MQRQERHLIPALWFVSSVLCHLPSCSACASTSGTCRLNTFQQPPKAPDLLLNPECQWGSLQQDLNLTNESFGSVHARTHTLAWLIRVASLFNHYVLHSSSNCKTLPAWFVFVLFLVPPPLLLSFSTCPNLFSSPPWAVEDVSNLTASDVMNRVNLGYLQGNVCAVCDSCTHVSDRPSRRERT